MPARVGERFLNDAVAGAFHELGETVLDPGSPLVGRRERDGMNEAREVVAAGAGGNLFEDGVGRTVGGHARLDGA